MKQADRIYYGGDYNPDQWDAATIAEDMRLFRKAGINLLTLPVFFPIVTALDFGMPTDDIAIWFGILVLIVVGIGMTCPPIGLNVFVVASLARDVPVTRIYRGVLPFVGADVIRLGICVAFPALSLYLVKLLN